VGRVAVTVVKQQQGDQMVYFKKSPQMQPNPHFVKFNEYFFL
jgi:hypothetical protein